MSLIESGPFVSVDGLKIGRRPNGFTEFLASRRGEWRCAFCTKSYSSEGSLMKHTKDVHVGRNHAVR